ncbi:MAG TPA: hypothetical protein VMH03_11430 [Terriglobales bacterium]|nr:hypothetical protein [Terriglobales bacterium]
MRFGSTSKWVVALGLLGAEAIAQTAPPTTASVAPAPVPYSSMSELNRLLSQVEQMSQSTQADFEKLRIEKWKTDGSTKRATETDVGSIQRNLQSALPEIVTQLRSSPEDLSASFKLYRNLDALYDVLTSVVESAGAFGPKDDFQLLQEDLDALERSRRSMADRMESLTASKENELARLRGEVRTLQAAQTPAAPPKKVVVDDTEAPKKTTKKKSTTKTTKPASSTSTQNSSNSGTQPVQQQNPPNPPQSPQP